ncbi:hypothetical protein EYF80_020066 [Liparis tanakae]|uniref:Uncharacterized protein n=1 Tax=Liparis tanakae TaxID=230148 RepID=A0A4Z2HXP7_9TELE|nr:hypothetical protein EYF80_020066 [Liparis tanakae]
MARLEPPDLLLGPGCSGSPRFNEPSYDPGSAAEHQVRLYEASQPEGALHEERLRPCCPSLSMDIHQGDLVHMQLYANLSQTVDHGTI